ncbi:hypothetical protein [Micromonospora sp. NPDC050695]|uniref:hypothetical protein n=1 Tax=Micromonospora sp. NPDC050695 TaxID=3154938 RepID=UPI0033D4FDC9
MWDGQYQTQRYIVDALADDDDNEFEVSVATGACIATATAAIVRWAESGGIEDLDALMAAALRTVTQSPDGGHHGERPSAGRWDTPLWTVQVCASMSA